MEIDFKKEDLPFVILAILSIIFFFWYVFGDSPTMEQSLLLALLAVSFKNNRDVATLKERLKNHIEKHE